MVVILVTIHPAVKSDCSLCLSGILGRGHCQVAFCISRQLPFHFLGIFYDPKCHNDTVNHVVLVVGYGFEGNETDGNNYWLVKNRYGLSTIKENCI